MPSQLKCRYYFWYFIGICEYFWLIFLGSASTLASYSAARTGGNKIDVRRHSLQRKPSNHRKSLVMKNLFRAFVKSSRSTNGRAQEKKWWLDSRFKFLLTPLNKVCEADKGFYSSFLGYLETLKSGGKAHLILFIVGKIWFIFVLGYVDQTETVAEITLHKWFREEFPDTGICPHKTDYCQTCFEYGQHTTSYKQQLNMLKVYKIKKLIYLKVFNNFY